MINKILTRCELVRELAVKDLRLRYSRASLGIFWVFLSPLLTVGVFYLVFNFFLEISTQEAPFILYLMTGIFSWRFFQDSLMGSVTSLIDNKNLIRESNFPHYIVPLAIVISNGIIFIPSFVIFIFCALIVNQLSLWVLLFPLVFAIHFTIVLGISIAVSILYVRFRDIKYIIEAVLLFLFYLTPVFYSIILVKNAMPVLLFKIYMYSPFTALLNLYRAISLKEFYSFLQPEIHIARLFLVLLAVALVTLLLGFFVYKINKTHINDYLSY